VSLSRGGTIILAEGDKAKKRKEKNIKFSEVFPPLPPRVPLAFFCIALKLSRRRNCNVVCGHLGIHIVRLCYLMLCLYFVGNRPFC
jgi:hypothetical protein